MPDRGRRGGAREKYPGPGQRGEVKTIIKRKLTPLVVILVALIVVPVAYALFPAIQVVTELTVKEPLSLFSASVFAGVPGGPWVSGTCTVSKQATLFASCTVSGFAGETVRVLLFVSNAGKAEIPIAVSTASSSPDVELQEAEFCTPSTCTTGSGVVEVLYVTSISVEFAISPSAAPGLVELVVEVVR